MELAQGRDEIGPGGFLESSNTEFTRGMVADEPGGARYGCSRAEAKPDFVMGWTAEISGDPPVDRIATSRDTGRLAGPPCTAGFARGYERPERNGALPRLQRIQ